MNVSCAKVPNTKPVLLETKVEASCSKCRESFQVDVTKDLPGGLTAALLERVSQDGFIMAVKRYCPYCGEVVPVPFRVGMVKGLVCSKVM